MSGIFSKSQREIVVRLLSENFRQQAPTYAVAIVSMIFVAAMTSASAWIMRDIVNETVVSKDLDRVFKVAMLVAVIFTVKGLATYVQSVYLSRAGNNIIATTQKKLFDHILKQGIRFYSLFPSSELLMRITTNAQATRMVLDVLVTSFVRDLFTLIGLLIVMVVQQPMLSLFSALGGPVALYLIRMLTKKVRKLMEQEMASLGQIMLNVQETALGIKVVKAFALEDFMRSRMEKYVNSVETRSNDIARLEAATSPVMETLSGFAIAGVVALSGILVLQKGNTPGELMSFVTALLLAYDPAKRLARLRINLETGLVGVRMMYELLDHPVDFKEAEGAVDLPKGPGEITFKDVDFSYLPGQALFSKLNISFPAGSATALVGPSGGGKSSIVNLAMRLYDVEGGSILIDGHDLRSLSFKSLRDKIAYVSQDTFLFSGTIRENIALGRIGCTVDDIVRAAKDANAHDFIMQLPAGYDTQTGENGGSLSGGQKQRIAIARAVLRNAEILILDEATSALDSESEALVRDAIDRISKGRTTITVAHRFASVVSADRVVVIEDGKVAEQGTLTQLLAQDGAFKRLYELQMLP